jgi:hypothetical protein
MTEVFFVGSREVREVPQGWQHPKDERGRYIPLLPFGYQIDDDERAPADRMMPPPLGDIEIAAYETVTEGTPISPAFPDTPQGRLNLLAYCAEHCTTIGEHRGGVEAWAAFLFGDAAIGIDGQVIRQRLRRGSSRLLRYDLSGGGRAAGSLPRTRCRFSCTHLRPFRTWTSEPRGSFTTR